MATAIAIKPNPDKHALTTWESSQELRRAVQFPDRPAANAEKNLEPGADVGTSSTQKLVTGWVSIQ